MTSARQWLESRADDVPTSLRQRMLDAVAATHRSPDPAPLQLAAAAMECVRDATACGDDRTAAIHLLAADALMTDAIELASGDAVLLRRIAAEYGPAAIEARLDPSGTDTEGTS